MRGCATLVLTLAAVALPACQEPRPDGAGTLRLTVFELKLHGLAMVLETPSGAAYVIDAGKKEGDVDSGRDVVAPYLKGRGIREIAGLIVSHPHHDHFEGATYLLKHFRVKSFADAGLDGSLVDEGYRTLRAQARERAGDVKTLRAGDVLKWGEALEVTVLAPPAGGVRSSDRDFLNNNSLVLRVRHGKNVFLLPGDIESEGRDSLLASTPAETLKATVLVGPHHGFFESRRFAEVVKPEIVVVSCLAEYADKKPKSPGDLASQVFGAVGAKVFVTAWHGRVEVVSDGAACTVKTERERK